MRTTYKIHIQGAVGTACLLFLALAGCAGPGGVRQEGAELVQPSGVEMTHDSGEQNSRAIQPGDSALVHYICRLTNGEIVAATDRVAEDEPKSNIFLAEDETGPLLVIAVSPEGPAGEEKEKAFEDEVEGQLARAVVGMKESERRHVELTARNIPARDGQNYISHLSRVRKRPKELKMAIEEYRLRAGKTPELGQAFSIDPAFPGRVEEVTDQDVVIRFSAKLGEVVQTPFGPGLIREEGNNYLVDINARKGALARAGNLVGRISEVDDRAITVDFRDLFGGETLSCEVEVEKIADAKSINETQEKSDR